MPKQDIDLKCPQCGSECEWLDNASTKVCRYCGYRKKYTGSLPEQVINLVADKAREKRERRDAVYRREQERRDASNKRARIIVAICFVACFAVIFLMVLLVKAGIL